MKYQDFKKETTEEYAERLELVMERMEEIAAGPETPAPYDAYFREAASCLLLQREIWQKAVSGQLEGLSAEEASELNRRAYFWFCGEEYEKNFADHAFAVRTLGSEFGSYLAAVFAELRRNLVQVYRGIPRRLCLYTELLSELHAYFAAPDTLTPRDLKDCIRSFHHDYAELFQEIGVSRVLDPEFSWERETVMEGNPADPATLYRYGLFVGEDELASQKKLAAMPEEEIRAMADTMTEGYRIGFEVMNKPLDKKKIVHMYYPIGFERVIRAAVENYAAMGMDCVFEPYSTSSSRQMDYDHKEDSALYLDKEFVEYEISCFRNAHERYKETAPLYGGPDAMEIFGELPFTPEEKEANPRFDEKQRKLSIYQRSNFSRIRNQYIHGEERCFSIIAYPVASIGPDYEEIFAETVKLNTLDYKKYQTIQQHLIDALDQADRVHVLGSGANRTDLYVKVWELQDPQKESAFENCVADVNIPLGEVFTSPVLKGTTGKLHVSQVYLEEYGYKDLEIDFTDGMITGYNCGNFPEEKQNKQYIEDNILFHHPTLPMGEFAIGTNTTAYRMGKVYGIQDKLPILIAEKTGPHFAVGDTCYTYDEDNMTYNPDGKAIVARENDFSRLRHEDLEKAYFNCHTDITIPYNELKAITVIRKDGSCLDIIRDGRFVLEGTEELNIALEGLD